MASPAAQTPAATPDNGGRTSKPGRATTSGIPLVWGNVPQRNKNFTGRESLLDELHDQVTREQGEVAAVLAHTLHGMGGVGKTQLAIEYVYRYMADYDVVWWVAADQLPLVRSSLAQLAPRLGLEEILPGRVDDAVALVLDALRRGDPYANWLVVFDNADQPEEIRDLIPTGPGNVIVTSRNHRWESVADVVEVDVFSRTESLEYLSRRTPHISSSDATALADELGDLPLALEQAASLQFETKMPVAEYLSQFRVAATKVLSENPPADYPVPVAAAWSLSVERLKGEMPFAWELLRRCAFFGPSRSAATSSRTAGGSWASPWPRAWVTRWSWAGRCASWAGTRWPGSSPSPTRSSCTGSSSG